MILVLDFDRFQNQCNCHLQTKWQSLYLPWQCALPKIKCQSFLVLDDGTLEKEQTRWIEENCQYQEVLILISRRIFSKEVMVLKKSTHHSNPRENESLLVHKIHCFITLGQYSDCSVNITAKHFVWNVFGYSHQARRWFIQSTSSGALIYINCIAVGTISSGWWT